MYTVVFKMAYVANFMCSFKMALYIINLSNILSLNFLCPVLVHTFMRHSGVTF